jgi:glycosyltransferase involved in cell wall biosynthesis
MQEPPTGVSKDESWFEILIHDDASTDGTDAIIREYAAQYPDKIFPLYEESNQYSHGGRGRMDLYNYNRVRGRYIATCEADDYWTNPHKLQKQVDFMERNPEYSVCWHRVKRFNVTKQVWSDDDCERFLGDSNGKDIALFDTLNTWYTQPLSMLFRMSVYDLSWFQRYKYYRDMHEIYHLLSVGKGYLFSFVGGVYLMHENGVSSLISNAKFIDIANKMDREFYMINRDKYSLETYKRTLDTSFGYLLSQNKKRACSYIFRRFWLTKDIKKMIKQLIKILI